VYTFKSKAGTPEWFAEVEDLAKQTTDHMTMVDSVFAASKQGLNMVPVFQCTHSGLYLPADWGKNWKKYATGLGPVPVSPVLDSQYHIDPPAITAKTRRIEQIMHPVAHIKSDVQLITVTAAAAKDPKNQMIMMADDPDMELRSVILRNNQLKNPKGRLGLVQAAWASVKGSAK